MWRIIHLNTPLQQALEEAAALSSHDLIRVWLKSAIAKVAESNDPSAALSRQEFVDDIAITSMTRLWDVGKSEPIKVGKASPTEGALPSALYFALKYRPPTTRSPFSTAFEYSYSKGHLEVSPRSRRYHDNFEKAIIANANVGGDSAARGIVIGMLLGAAGSWQLDASHRWVAGLNSMQEVQALISEFSNLPTDL